MKGLNHTAIGKALIEGKGVLTFQELWQRQFVPYTIVAKALHISPRTFKGYTQKPSTLPPQIITQIAKYFGVKKQPLQELINAGIKKENNG